MNPVLRMSDAASLAVHVMVLLTRSGPTPRSVPTLAVDLGVSSDHLSKVMQRLARGGLVRAGRGRNGGYSLARPSGEIRMLDVVEVIEGPMEPAHCLFGKPLCKGDCLFGDLVASVDAQVRERLAGTTLAAAAGKETP